MTKKILWRCNSGHYYSERNCPLDGWSRPELQRLFDVVTEMQKNGEPVSIQALRKHGFDQAVLDRVIAIEFGGEKSTFDGFDPNGYIIQGKYVPLSKLDIDHS
jgi:hypothetical protein